MNTTKEVNDNRTGCRTLCHFVFGEYPVCQQYTQTRTGVCFQHVHNRFTCFCSLFDTDWCEDTMVDGVVQEQYLRRFYEDCYERQQFVCYQNFNTCCQDCKNRSHNRPNQIIANDCKNHTKNPNREVVYQHFKAGRNFTFHCFVKFFDDQAGKRTHCHSTDEHGLFGTGDNTQCCNGTHNAATVAANHSTTLECNQSGNQVFQHRIYQCCQSFIWNPTCFDEQSCNKAPSNERPDIRHNHCTQEFPEFLNAIFH